MTFEEITKIHTELDGQCQKCHQRCDKRVVSMVADDDDSLLMVCPDCKQGKERPFFKVSSNIAEFCSQYTGWNMNQAIQYLQFIPLGITLIHHNENTRSYWNWDKAKHIFAMETDHMGNILDVKYYPKKTKGNRRLKKEKNIKLKNTWYKVVSDRESINLKRITVSEEFKASPPSSEKVAKNIAYFEKHGCFEKPVILEKISNSKKNSYMIIDGYSAFIAAQELNLRVLEAMTVLSLIRTEPSLIKSRQ
ncbi:hypothetical protein [Solibacillus isronensis]|uniref:hypothetical protein n=1 Tax=Solibacillus isronensis TaxID=412383 RepID=UPI00203E271E|nr:hypothetical protein [Solibacillus isronensis]MCM3723985.1 hypothetical protein [Solibacillus isronensis]